MPRIIIHHPVQNFDDWKREYVEHEKTREKAGFIKSRVFQDIDNPNQVTVQLDCEDLAAAKSFIDSESLAETMKKAGVTGLPQIHFLNDGETFSH